MDNREQDGISLFVRQTLYGGPTCHQLYLLRKRRPELSVEIDAVVMSLKGVGDRIEEFVRRQIDSVRQANQKAASDQPKEELSPLEQG
jgi:hypothetical protein